MDDIGLAHVTCGDNRQTQSACQYRLSINDKCMTDAIRSARDFAMGLKSLVREEAGGVDRQWAYAAARLATVGSAARGSD
jgi:hypothetical protein